MTDVPLVTVPCVKNVPIIESSGMPSAVHNLASVQLALIRVAVKMFADSIRQNTNKNFFIFIMSQL